MRKIEIAMAALQVGEDYLMQHRNHDPSKAAAGLIGFFGGQVEEDESSQEAVSREIGEETNLLTKPEDFILVGPFQTTMEHNNEELEIIGNIYHYDVPPGKLVVAQEGEVVQIARAQLLERIDDFSPATVEAIKRYFRKGKI